MTQNSACSPGLSRFTAAASRPPVPLHGYKRMSLSVRSAHRKPPTTSSSTAANSGPRWLIMGRLAERTTRAGSGVGPGTRSCGSPMARSLSKAGLDAARDRRQALELHRDAAAEKHLGLHQPAASNGAVLGVPVALARGQLVLLEQEHVVVAGRDEGEDFRRGETIRGWEAAFDMALSSLLKVECRRTPNRFAGRAAQVLYPF